MIRLMVVLELNLKLMPFSKIAFFSNRRNHIFSVHVNEVIWGLVLVNLAHAVVWLGRGLMTGYLIHSDYKKPEDAGRHASNKPCINEVFFFPVYRAYRKDRQSILSNNNDFIRKPFHFLYST